MAEKTDKEETIELEESEFLKFAEDVEKLQIGDINHINLKENNENIKAKK